jgi:hypothetical protein
MICGAGAKRRNRKKKKVPADEQDKRMGFSSGPPFIYIF